MNLNVLKKPWGKTQSGCKYKTLFLTAKSFLVYFLKKLLQNFSRNFKILKNLNFKAWTEGKYKTLFPHAQP